MTVNGIGGVDWLQYTSESRHTASAMSTLAVDDSGTDTAEISSEGDNNLAHQSASGRVPVNGYFKQLQDYYVAKAERARASAQSGQAADSDPAVDEVEPSLPIDPSGRAFCYLDTLTGSDKAFIKGATGWDIDDDPLGATASPEAKAFVGRLTLDRYTFETYGSADGFTGQIDKEYIQHVIQEQLDGQGMVPLSILWRAQAYLDAQPAGTSQPAGRVSWDKAAP